jgi:pimeloyl-ACP methyl ester carboxylesterase
MNDRTALGVDLRSEWITCGALSIHARVGGGPPAAAGRPPVILVHGFVLSSRVMIPAARLLAAHFPVYAPDLPGFGDSDKPKETFGVEAHADALVAWMDAMGLSRAAMAGNSLGCQVIVEVAVRHPERVERLVLQGPTIEPNARNSPAMSRRLWQNMTQEKSPELSEMARIDYAKAGISRVVKTARHAYRDAIETKLPRVAAPTLVIRGERDPVISLEWAQTVSALLPRGRLAAVAGQSHTVHFIAAAEFAALVRSFLLEDEVRSGEAGELKGSTMA